MSDRQQAENLKFHWGLLLVWIAIGFGLRFANLDAKPPSSIEISTLGFSSGNGFLGIPLDEAIALKTLLAPLQLHSAIGTSDVIDRLLNESNHPPFYFVLTHLWLKLFSLEGETASLWAARSLSAFIGVASIPAMFGLGWLAFRSLIVAQISAALMAVSPYGIYLAQEARHYTLSVLWIIASLCCLVEAIRRIEKAEGRRQRSHCGLGVSPSKARGVAEGKSLEGNSNVHQVNYGQSQIYRETHTSKIIPNWLVFSWIIVNSLGIATHYLFVLVLGAEALIIFGDFIRLQVTGYREGKRHKSQGKKRNLPHSLNYPLTLSAIFPLIIVGIGTLAGALVWLPVAGKVSDNELTQWVKTSLEFGDLWEPIPRLLAWWITMGLMLPVEGTPILVTIISGLVMVLFLGWALPALFRGLKVQMASPNSRLGVWILGGFLLSAIAIFVAIIYGDGKDLSKAARYHFVYFPAAIALLAAAVAVYWEKKREQLGTRHQALGKEKEEDKNVSAKYVYKNQKEKGRSLSLSLSPRLPITASPSLALLYSLFQHKEKRVVVIILLMGFLGGLTVVSNYGYQKSKQSDRLAAQIYETSTVPTLIAMTYESHAELRTLISLGLEIERQEKTLAFSTSKFLLLHNSQEAFSKLTQIVTQLPRPLDLWAVDLQIDKNALESLNCHQERRKFPSYGYRYWVSHCR